MDSEDPDEFETQNVTVTQRSYQFTITDVKSNINATYQVSINELQYDYYDSEGMHERRTVTASVSVNISIPELMSGHIL